jgi:hypothetical protein
LFDLDCFGFSQRGLDGVVIRRKIFIRLEQICVDLECSIVKGCLVLACLAFSSMLLVVGLSLVVGVALGVHGSLVWEGDVYSSGVSVASPVLVSGTSYRIVAAEQWFYDNPNSLAADAQYYTNSSVDTWDWPNHYRPGSHSFLQINGQDVDWGPFSNGHTGHTYSIYYNGADAPITFAIVDWMDSNYGNNFCHLHLRIYAEITVGGRVVDSSPSGTVSVFAVGALLLASFATVPVIVHHRKT